MFNSLKSKIILPKREPMPYGRVLVVDDVDSNLYITKGFLIPYKLSVDTVESGFLAIEKIKDGEVYDIIFMDHMMPEMDGMETTKILREMGYEHPIIALTANAFSDMVDVFMRNGFSSYASKPIDINQMDRHLLHFIRDKQPVEVIEQARLANASINIKQSGRISEVLLLAFLRDAKKAIELLSAIDINRSGGATDSDLKSYITQVHAMKSALNNIGRKGMSNKALVLEQAGRNEDMQTIIDNTPQFLSRLNEIINELEGSIKEGSPDEDTEENIAFLRNRMSFIYDACEFFNIDEAKDALAELSNRNYSKQIKALIGEIYDHLLSGDIDEASELAKQAAHN